MLRLHPYEYHRPATVEEAVTLLAEHAGDVMPIAGGTDLVPNMKHRLFTPGHLVSLRGIESMRRVDEEEARLQGLAARIDALNQERAKLVHQLKELGELKQQGILTDAEFEAKKKQLLGL